MARPPQARRACTAGWDSEAGTGIRALTLSHIGPTSAKPPGFHGGFRCSFLQGGGEQNLGPHPAR